MGKTAKDFVDFLKKSGQEYWQILPLNPVGYGNSPYQSCSVFAGNPLLIDLGELVKMNLLTEEECSSKDFGNNPQKVDFQKVETAKTELLESAFKKFHKEKSFNEFTEKEKDWLDDYAVFAAIKEASNNKPFTQWETRLGMRIPEAIDKMKDLFAERIEFRKFLQYIFFKQWKELKDYANEANIKIIGDMPIYAAADSADVWAKPENFLVDAEKKPVKVAGVPPDYFSKTGQLWGNPLYNWNFMRKSEYDWWKKRIKKASEMYDVLRIDHFRAFDTYYTIPAGDKTAEKGKWEIGPGMAFFDAVNPSFGETEVIAEDLGELFDSVKILVEKSGFPGMRVMQFGFNPEHEDNCHLPHNYTKNTVVYTGTHDNSTIAGWYKTLGGKTRLMLKNYVRKGIFERLPHAFIRMLYASTADTVIIPFQDVLCLDDTSRMNTPSTINDANWSWRLEHGFKKYLRRAKYLRGLSEAYFR
jgi:4-alpha-glucanotransferase